MAHTAYRITSSFAGLALLAACSATLPPQAPVPAVPFTHSVEQANDKLEGARRERSAIEARYGADEVVCAQRFFVNRCLEGARETRRAALAEVRAVELEAEYFKRKHAADERDRALAEVQQQAEAQAAARAAEALAAPREEAAPALPKPGITPQASQAAHAAKMKAIAAREAAEAPQRAANAAAFEAKQKEAARRKQRVEEKKARSAARDGAPE